MIFERPKILFSDKYTDLEICFHLTIVSQKGIYLN